MKKTSINYKGNFNNLKVSSSIFILFLIMFSTESSAQTDTIQTNVPALKEVYEKHFKMGCILSYRHVGFPDDPYVPGQSSVISSTGGQLVRFHMNSMTPGNNMKSQYTVDINASAAAYAAATTDEERDSIDIHPVIRFNGDLIAQLNWAQRQGFTFRGHVLVWYNQNPGTAFFRTGYSNTGTRLTKERMTERMEYYIKEVIRLLHEGWPGLLSAMDVVNEAVNDGTGTDRTDNNEWYTTFGDISYIMKAFEFARKYTIEYEETQMKLYYNDYNTDNSSKADGIVRILTPIYQADYLDGIGLQGHEAITYPSVAAWVASYNKFDPICDEMSITEYYIDQQTANPTEADLQRQANRGAQLFKLFMDRSFYSGKGKIFNVTKDGLNDQYTLFPNTLSSLWDSNNQCKPVFYAVANVGINYTALDSLISYADTLQETDYTPESWLILTSALMSARNAMVENYSVTVSAADALGEAKDNLKAAIDGLMITDVYDNVNNIKTFALLQNYPNPFNPSTTIRYSVEKPTKIKLIVYNLFGQKIKTLVDSFQNADEHTIVWDGTNDNNNPVSSGIYLYKLETENINLCRKMALIR
jgi:endo-1,4-beta-xylanase